MSNYVDLLPVIVQREGARLPEGFDTWGLKSVQPDLRTHNGYQWPYPGGIAFAGAVNPGNIGKACPSRPGDGLCVATTWRGMASGSIPARTLLLVATSSADVLGADLEAGKTRHECVAVVAIVDGQRLLRDAGAGADLSVADLSGASLPGASLSVASLYRADLSGADLSRADLRRANLRRANLSRANLYGASLSVASLYGADLPGADLRRADLYGADLSGADLSRADLRGADLRRADLYGADLSGALRD